ncbi:MAG: hypothetical protein IPJ65_07615 [Archangiaceae bacterium]|nr:hypothetical protein [Archangiaceae bacterium]
MRCPLALLVTLAACTPDSPCDPSRCDGVCSQGVCVAATGGGGATGGGATAGGGAGGLGGGGGGSGTAGGTAHSGESCTDPVPLDLSTGSVYFHQAAGSANDTAGTCGGATGPDRVYTFTLTQPTRLSAAAYNTFGSQTALYLRSSCDDGELTCATGNFLNDVPLAAGTWFLWVDGVSDDFDLAVQTSRGDDCTDPEPLTFDSQGFASVEGTFEHATPTFGSACQSMMTKDRVYQFTLTTPQRFVASSHDEQSHLFLSLRNRCEVSGGELACNPTSLMPGVDRAIAAPLLAPGTYFLVVGITSGRPEFRFTAHLGPPAEASGAEACAATTPVTLTPGTSSAVLGAVGSTVDRPNTSACQASSSPDTAHQLVVPAGHGLELQATSVTAGRYLDLMISGPSSSCPASTSTPLKCTDLISYGNLTFSSLAPGTYWVWVYGKAGTQYVLETSLTP